MIDRLPWLLPGLVCAALASAAPNAAMRDRRIVDTVQAGDARSEAAHGYVGIETTTGAADGIVHRETRGWMRYALSTFEDTEVTVSCTFAPIGAGDGASARRFDVVVEDSLIATPELISSAPSHTVDVPVPLGLTRGKSNIAVVIRARDGATPALRTLRTVQDHNQQDHNELDHHAQDHHERALHAPPRSSYTPGVLR